MESGIDSKPRILLISAADPCKVSGHLGMDFYNAFKSQGYDIDLLTKCKVPHNKEILYVMEERAWVYSIFSKVRRKLLKIITKEYPLAKYCFFYNEEKKPPVPSDMVVNCINKPYDLIFVLFWNDLLSVEAIEKIYQKYHVPFFFIAVDYSPITGGCHYFGECTRYKEGCGCCPALVSSDPNDFTHSNALYRKEVYDKVKPVIWGNKYMKTFIKQSFLFGDKKIETIFPIINETVFTIRDKIKLRKTYNIPDSKKFVLFFGAQDIHDRRKGIKYLIEALDIFFDSLTVEQRKEVLILIAGRSKKELNSLMKFDFRELGLVDFTILPQIYSLSDVFLSPSVEDAGPMMVNQSLSCGIPVVSFNIGTAIEVIKDKGTGYCAMLKDAMDFSKGIRFIYELDASQKKEMSDKCRNMALVTTSYEVNVKKIINVYHSILEQCLD